MEDFQKMLDANSPLDDSEFDEETLSIPEMIKKFVKYDTEERSCFNFAKFQTINITFETKKGKVRLNYTFSCDACRCPECIPEFRVLKDHDSHPYECRCEECDPPEIRPKLSRYVFIEKYLLRPGSIEYRVNRDPFNIGFLRTIFPSWLYEK
tara:strand:+ start:124 stop:579 length:456 start_codon:yes stop_codon:yes gene_type:complete